MILLRVTSQALYSPEYIAPTQKIFFNIYQRFDYISVIITHQDKEMYITIIRSISKRTIY
jgi:hypothetical protein